MDKIPFSVYDFFAYLSSGAIVVACIDYIGQYGLATRPSISSVLALYLVVAAYILGQISAQLSSLLFESGLINRILGQPMTHLLCYSNDSWKKIVFPGFFRCLPRVTRGRIEVRAERLGINPKGPEIFHHTLAIVTAENEKTQERIDSFRNQYGFARNAAFSLFTSSIAISLAILQGRPNLHMRWAVIAAFAGCMMVYRYLKFYRQYSYEVLFRYSEETVV